jgi:hypothetical protein
VKGALKPKDVVVASKLIAVGGYRSYDFLSESLGMARSQIHDSVKRLEKSGLSDSNMRIDKKAFMYFILMGLRYVFPVEKIGKTKGIMTGLAVVEGVPLNALGDPETCMVWPSPSVVAAVEGDGIEPLHESCLTAVKDRPFWELLALIDVIREGQGDVKRAAKELKDRL